MKLASVFMHGAAAAFLCLAAGGGSAQIALPSAENLSLDERIERLAEREARRRSRVESAIFEDRTMRAEIRRIGFAKGCGIVDSAGKEVLGRHAPALQVEIAQAIRKVVPAKRLEQPRALSFMATPLISYKGRLEAELEQRSADVLGAAREDMRRTFLAATRPLPATTDPADNRVMPKPDVAAALGLKGPWDLDRPEELAFACAEQLIPPQMRPAITTGPTPR